MEKDAKRVLLGNEAISRGLIEAGVQFMTAYPGTPSSEILPAVVRYKEELGLDTYVEWSTNEKVALETALAAAYSGKRTAVAMKQVGLNVAADPALSSAYIGVVGGLVLIVADDPGPHSSQTEQDSRLFALFAKIPALDPSDPQEAKELAQLAFDLSERHQIPVLLRPTVRVCHAKQYVTTGPVTVGPKEAAFVKNPRRWAATPKARLALHQLLNQKLAAIEKEFEGWEANRVSYPKGSEGKTLPLGIVACGVTYAHLKDLLEPLGLTDKLAVLKIATAYPLPRALVAGFAARCERLLVLEEPDFAVETQIRVGIPVWGRLTGHIPSQGELTPEVVEELLVHAALEAGLEPRTRDLGPIRRAVASLELPIRRPTLCPGCGHRAAFYGMKRAFPDAIFPGDIGCYTLGLNLGAVDTVHDMGASISMAAGFYHAYAQDGLTPPIIATIGDGTFFHSGAAGLENAVYNGSRFVLVVLDNEITGMTGMQPTPEFGATADGHPGKKIELEPLIRGCGVEYLVKADPFDLGSYQRALIDAVAHTRSPGGGVAVIITRYPCVTLLKGLGDNLKPMPVEVLRGPVPRGAAGLPGLAPAWMPRHEDKISPCVETCPAGNDIERVMTLAAEGRFADAAALFYEEHPFPSTLGRVCPHPCEASCNRKGFDGALTIRAIERLSGDAARSAASLDLEIPRRETSVAVVGGGPAGLTAAYHLARLGHRVEVFEAQSRPGGMLAWAIPGYRLPGEVLDRELAVFGKLGVRINTGMRLGRDFSFERLGDFDAAFLATGAWKERTLSIPGEEREGVLKGLEFLRRLRAGEKVPLGRRVAVIGGGNTAIDAARSARRLGAEVTVYYRRTEELMRAIPEEVEAARGEGIFLRFQVVPLSIAKGLVRRISLTLRETSHRENGHFSKPFPGVESSNEFVAEADTVICAIGAVPDLAYLPLPELKREEGIAADAWGRTRASGIFAGGDAATGSPGTVAGAVNAGKRAALAIHSYLTGEELGEKKMKLVRGPGIAATAGLMNSPRAGRVQASIPMKAMNLRSFQGILPAVPRKRSPDEAIWGFEEVELGLTPDRGSNEAGKRCFHCGVCTRCDICLKACPVDAIRKTQVGYEVDVSLCTGCRLCQVECPRSAITMPRLGVCVACGYCVTACECPALVRDAEGYVDIDRRICIDCGFCAQVCPQGAIRAKEQNT